MNAVPMKRYVHKSVFDAALASGPDEFKLLKVLDDARPVAIRIRDLQSWAGMTSGVPATYCFFNGEKFNAYVKFACALVRLKHVLLRHGWQIVMTGGTVDDYILLSEQSGSPG